MANDKVMDFDDLPVEDGLDKVLEKALGQLAGAVRQETLKDVGIKVDSCFDKAYEYLRAAVEVGNKTSLSPHIIEALTAVGEEFNKHKEEGIPGPCIRKTMTGLDELILALKMGTQLNPDKETRQKLEDILNYCLIANAFFHFALDAYRRERAKKDIEKSLWTAPTPKEQAK